MVSLKQRVFERAVRDSVTRRATTDDGVRGLGGPDTTRALSRTLLIRFNDMVQEGL